MGELREYCLGLLLGLGLTGPAMAGPNATSTELAQNFASCLGRYSAQMEHHFLMGEPAERSIARRALFEDLLFAVQPDAADLSGHQILSLRIEAKHAQTRLLQMATFNLDVRLARNAQAQARRQLRACEMLVLG